MTRPELLDQLWDQFEQSTGPDVFGPWVLAEANAGNALARQYLDAGQKPTTEPEPTPPPHTDDGTKQICYHCGQYCDCAINMCPTCYPPTHAGSLFDLENVTT